MHVLIVNDWLYFRNSLIDPPRDQVDIRSWQLVILPPPRSNKMCLVLGQVFNSIVLTCVDEQVNYLLICILRFMKANFLVYLIV